jgi:hypothetical protein
MATEFFSDAGGLGQACPIVPLEQLLPGDYANFARPVLESLAKPALTTREIDVAEAI